MSRYARLISVVTLLLAVSAGVTTTAGAAGPDPASVNMRDLEKQVFAAVNSIRTNPAQLAANLATVQAGATGNGNLSFTYPDGTTSGAGSYYLNTALAQAKITPTVTAFIWSDGLATAARNYADRSPQGHEDFGTTLGSRLAEVGVGSKGIAEAISYNGATGLAQVYNLFIDNGTPDFGHRMGLINGTYTHLGVGCHYTGKDITCVLDIGLGWTDANDTIKPEVGKQYAYQEGPGVFRYFTLRTTTGGGPFPVTIDVCPLPSMGSISSSSVANLMTVQQAAQSGLVAKNQPCDTAKAPNGVLRNGTPYIQAPQVPGVFPGDGGTPTSTPATPTTSGSTGAPATTATTSSVTDTSPTSTPTASPTSTGSSTAPAAVDPTVDLRLGQQYVVRQGTSWRYFTLFQLRGATDNPQNYVDVTFQLCPGLNGTYSATDSIAGMTAYVKSPEAAKAAGITPTNQACGSGPAKVALEVGKQYAVREGGNTFRYFQLTTKHGTGFDDLVFTVCPGLNGTLFGGFGADDRGEQVLRAADTAAAGLIAGNAPCDPAKVPYGS